MTAPDLQSESAGLGLASVNQIGRLRTLDLRTMAVGHMERGSLFARIDDTTGQQSLAAGVKSGAFEIGRQSSDTGAVKPLLAGIQLNAGMRNQQRVSALRIECHQLPDPGTGKAPCVRDQCLRWDIVFQLDDGHEKNLESGGPEHKEVSRTHN